MLLTESHNRQVKVAKQFMRFQQCIEHIVINVLILLPNLTNRSLLLSSLKV